ncbi:hypothetical protein HQQ94_01235 [Shewanella sp. VB17]|uniref:hypothetical protein n=1 Tax=Shewanella sp. VB17 TaxID=2739432 RepID=UPI001564AB21|nr:hypothetical protein [Shewanella sp. VB17]NRD71889.1 hypothetical protein [Shewanella sp. VB17]
MLKKTLATLATLGVITGCQSTVTNVCPSSTRVEIPMSSHPVKGSANTKVVIFEPEMKFNNTLSERVGASLFQALAKQISNAGSKIVDRSLVSKLKTEIQITEASGRFSEDGVPIADFAIYTDIGLANFTRNFSEARSWTEDGVFYSIPASCRFNAEVEASTRAISLPSMQTLKRIQFKGDDSLSVETRDSRCLIPQTEIEGMIAKAAKHAVERSDVLKNLFAPRGAVIEMRQCDAGSMVKVDMGSNQGVQPGWTVSFTTHEKVADLNGGYEIETHGYGTGEAINNAEHGIKPKYSWISLDKDVAMKVKRGDTAKAKFENACNGMSIFSGLCHITSENFSDVFSL